VIEECDGVVVLEDHLGGGFVQKTHTPTA
jgi:hypothetical protein